jgi:hypothetical protein
MKLRWMMSLAWATTLACSSASEAPSSEPAAKLQPAEPSAPAARTATADDPTEPAAAAAPTDAPAARACGRHTCVAGEFCEERYKGHGRDRQGRPLGRMACVAVPASCIATSITCACITALVQTTSCVEEAGMIFTSDAPK